MKILVITSLYPSAQEPNKAPFNFQTIKALSEFCEVKVISARPWWTRVRKPSSLVRVPSFVKDGIPVSYPSYWSIPGITDLHGRGLYRSLRPLVRKVFRQFRFDAILATWAYPDVYAASSIALDYKCPLIAKVHGSDINEFTVSPALRSLIVTGLARAERVIAVSGALATKLSDLGICSDRILVQHNAVDGSRFFPRNRQHARSCLGIASDTGAVLYVGRLSREKGVDILLNAFAQYSSAASGGVELWIVGDGPEAHALQVQADRLGLVRRVHFAGAKSPAEIPDWLSACDLLCLPSRMEGCPNVILEALASGRPVVAANVGGVSELLSSDNGEIVKPEDSGSLAEGLARAMNRKWSASALRDSVEFLSWGEVARCIHVELQVALARREFQNCSNVAPAAQ